MTAEATRSQILALLPAIFESVADGVTVLDRRGVVRFANATAAQLMGFQRAEEVIDRSSAELTGPFELLDPDGGPLDMTDMPTRRVLAGEEAAEAVIRFRHRDSLDERWSLVRARLMAGATRDDDLVVTAFQDITSLKQSERRLAFLSEASAILGESTNYADTLRRVADLAVPALADWCVVDVLESERDVRRVAVAHADPEKVALAEEYQRRWPPRLDGPGPVSEVMSSGTAFHSPVVTDEMLRASARDEEHLAAMRQLGLRAVLVVPLLARGRILGALTLVNSESDRLLTAEDVAMDYEVGRRAGAAIDATRLLWEREEAIRMRDEFMASASHDMRTPLAAVRGYAQLALRHLGSHARPDHARLSRWLGDIDDSAGRLTRLVSEFMDASLIRGGQEVPLQLQDTDLVPLVAERLEEHRRSSEDHDFKLAADAESVNGKWDPSRLARVLDNVLGNAAKFSPDGGGIAVRVGKEDRHGVVAVTDGGIGIAPADLDLIFTPTYRGSNAKRVSGTGLGLAGSRRLIEQMGGTITVASDLGKGSTFTIRLPLPRRRRGSAKG